MNALKNPYRGINPHLNSWLQTQGTKTQPSLWGTFHSRHITYLCDDLNERLPPNYIAFSEHSLQVQTVNMLGELLSERPKLDVTIFQTGRQPSINIENTAASVPVWQSSIVAMPEIENKLTAVVIREVSGQEVGEAVTRIELISPSNKPGGADYNAYLARRAESLQGGLPLVEIDYLHESPSIELRLPLYPNEPNSYPYTIAVSDPRPATQGVKVYGCHVDEALPTIPIPLSGDEQIIFDLDRVYQHTFQRGRWGQFPEVSQLPARFETYSPDARRGYRGSWSSLGRPPNRDK